MCEPPGGWATQRLCKADSDGGGCPGACAGVFCPHVAVIPGGVWRHLVEFFERSAVLLRCRIGVFGRGSLLVGS